MKEMIQYIPWETRKSEVLVKYLKMVERIFKKYEEDIRAKSNFTIIDNLSGNRLNRYGARFTINRKENWSDETLRRIIKMRRYIYDSNEGIVGNLANLMEMATGYEVRVERNGISGELEVTAIIQPNLSNDLMQEFDDFWVFGCRLMTSIKEVGYAIYETFGDLPFCNNTGIQDFIVDNEVVTSNNQSGYAMYETFGDLPFCNNTGIQDFSIRMDFLEIT